MWVVPVFVAYLILAFSIPVMWSLARVWRRAHIVRQVQCPEMGNSAVVDLDAWYAVKMHALGNRELCVRNCSRWSEKRGCEQACLVQIAAV
jgi:hypothetical protein